MNSHTVRQSHPGRLPFGSRPAEVVVAGMGFVGSYIAVSAVEANLRTHGIDTHVSTLPSDLGADPPVEVHQCDLRDRAQLTELLMVVRPRVLVLTARLDGNGAPSIDGLINAAAAAGVTRVLLISSLAVYGSARESGGLREATTPVDPSPYGQSKLEEEKAVAHACKAVGVPYLILRSTGAFGRLPAPRSSARASGAIDRVLRQRAAGAPLVLTVEEDPDQYLYARELGHVVTRALTDPPNVDVMNVGPGSLVEPSELHRAIQQVLGAEVELRTVPMTGRAIDLLNVERLGTWFPSRTAIRSDLIQGLRSAVDDFLRPRRAA